MAWLQYDYMDQNRNWSGDSKRRRRTMTTKSSKHILSRLARNICSTTSGARKSKYLTTSVTSRERMRVTKSPRIVGEQLGDIRIEGIYTGFFADLSAGVTFGLKLPTGSYTEDTDLVDRDTQIGTGSTDILLGGFFRHNLSWDEKWDALTVAIGRAGVDAGWLSPGSRTGRAAGVDYKGFSLGGVRISPIAQVIFSSSARMTAARTPIPPARAISA